MLGKEATFIPWLCDCVCSLPSPPSLNDTPTEGSDNKNGQVKIRRVIVSDWHRGHRCLYCDSVQGGLSVGSDGLQGHGCVRDVMSVGSDGQQSHKGTKDAIAPRPPPFTTTINR